MNVFKFQTPLKSIDEFINYSQNEPDVSWIRFGQEILFIANELPEKDFIQQPVHIYSSPDEAWQKQLHIVVQKGSIFQQHFPDVPIIHDSGRFLLVRLDSGLVERLKKKDHSEYGLKEFESGHHLFDHHNPATFRKPADPSIQSLIKELDRNKIEELLVILTSFYTRYSSSPEYMKVAFQMKDILDNMKYLTWVQPFAIDCNQSSVNIIADKPGIGRGERDVIIVSAHLDSVGSSAGSHIPAPGADDNGSGVAGLMEIARVFQNYQKEHDLRLILFGGEEQGFMGSKHYVANLSPFERARVKAIINMDMIGFLGSPSQNVMIEGSLQSQQVIEGLLEAAATYTNFSFIETSLNYDSSDHVPFIREKMPAVLTIEGVRGSNPGIHSTKDTISTINYDFVLEILKMNSAYISKELR